MSSSVPARPKTRLAMPRRSVASAAAHTAATTSSADTAETNTMAKAALRMAPIMIVDSLHTPEFVS